MTDSLQTVVTPEGYATLEKFMPYIMGIFIIPIVGYLKTKIKFMEPIYIKTALIVGASFGLAALFAPELTAEQTIAFALQSVGTAGLVYGGYKTTFKKKGTPQ